MKNILVYLVIVVSLSGAGALLPMTAYGATTAELQAQINALLAQIQTLQTQLAAPSSSSGSVPSALLSSGNLTVGSRGSNVTALQDFLGVSPATGYFGNLTKAALAKWQAANGVSPAAGYFGAVTRAKLATLSSGVAVPLTPSVPSVPAATAIEPPVAATATLPVTSAPANPFNSTLKIEGTYQSRIISTYGNKILNEFKLTADEKIGITRIKFKNTGTLSDVYLVNIQLINSRTDNVVATVDIPIDGVIEFKMTPDATKPDKGLAVSGETYYIYAYILTPNIGELKPKINLDIVSASDISAFDYNNLTRVANITKNNVFPVEGPTITVW